MTTDRGPNGATWWARRSKKKAWLPRPAKAVPAWHILLRRDTLAPKEDHASTHRSCGRTGTAQAHACAFSTGNQEQRDTETDRTHARNDARGPRCGSGRSTGWLISPNCGNRRPNGTRQASLRGAV